MKNSKNYEEEFSLYKGDVIHVIAIFECDEVHGKAHIKSYVTDINPCTKAWRAEKGKDPYIFPSESYANDVAFGILCNGVGCGVMSFPDVFKGMLLDNNLKYTEPVEFVEPVDDILDFDEVTDDEEEDDIIL